MAIDMTKTLIAGGVGGVDIYLAKDDDDKGRVKPFTERRVDMFRAAALGLGLIAQLMFPKYEKYGEALTLSSIPLFLHSAYRATQAEADRKGGVSEIVGPPISWTPRGRRFADQPGVEGIRLI